MNHSLTFYVCDGAEFAEIGHFVNFERSFLAVFQKSPLRLRFFFHFERTAMHHCCHRCRFDVRSLAQLLHHHEY